MAANRKPRHNNTVTQRRYGRRAICVSGEFIFQDGDAIDVGKLGGALSSLFLLFFNDLLAQAYFTVSYIHRTTLILRYNGLCDIRVHFVHDASQCAWRIIPIRYNNVRLSPLTFIPNISGLLCPRVLKALFYPRLS